MFDTMKVAKKIREARIAQNMTQMNLADAMGVSYQAVSNWERGNSMPDISKLEDLCGTLQISIAQLLGMETKETAAVTRILQEEDAPLTVEELSELAPVLPPAEVKKQAQKQKLNVAALVDIAPYLDEEFLGELLEDAEVESLLVLQSLAPYLDGDVLDRLVRRAPETDFDGIAAMAPFLEEETLDYLVKHCGQKPENGAFLEMLASYLDEDTLDWLVKKWGGDFDRDMLKMLAPFLEEETLDWLVKKWKGDFDKDMLETLAPFLEEETIDALVEAQIAKGNIKNLAGLYPFMDSDTVRKVVKVLMENGNLDAVKEAVMFL